MRARRLRVATDPVALSKSASSLFSGGAFCVFGASFHYLPLSFISGFSVTLCLGERNANEMGHRPGEQRGLLEMRSRRDL